MEARAATEAVDLDGQYRVLHESAGVVDRSGRGKLLVRGSDAAEFLQGQLTNDVEALEPGQGAYAALLDRKGHVQADMRVLRIEPHSYWIDTEAATRERVARHLEMYKVGRELEVEDVTADQAILSVIGPAAHEVTSAPPLSPEHAHRLDGERRVVATDLGLDLIVPAGSAGEVRAELLGAGGAEVSEKAAEIARVETGRPRCGAEMGEATMPAEAGIVDRAVSFTKGCYIGQEPVARLHYKGKPNRHLRGLRLSAPAALDDPIRLGDREVGRIGTVALSPARGPIALAIVRREASPGDTVAVGEDGAEAEVVALPF
jgi:tRNA-modifying protein YgfZ